MKHRLARLATVVLSTAVVVTGVVTSNANGSPIDDKRAEAQRLQQQIDANGMKIASLGERYNGAQLALDTAKQRVAQAEARLIETRQHKDRIQQMVRRRAASLYVSAGRTTPLSALDVSSVTDAARRSKYASAAAEHDTSLIAKLLDARDALREQQAQFRRQQDAAQAERDAAAQARASIETANARERQLLGQVKGEVAALMAAEQKRRDEAARQSAIVRTQPRSAPRGVDPGAAGGGNFPNVPTSGGVAAVIAYARAQIGKPYVFATAGPDTFDCSGLTMMAWRQAGVSMAHFSGSQYNQFPHVSISQLQPGDLVFKGPGGVDHVALYIGGGMQIAATHTGSFVKLQPLSSPLSGAVRPG